MKKEDRKMRTRSFGTTMGITSIIGILLILVLVVFSTLSLITAKADLTLSKKTSDNIKAYYVADGNAEIILAQFGQMINSGDVPEIRSKAITGQGEKFAKANSYEYESVRRTLKFTMPIDNSRELNVEVRYNDKGEVEEKMLWQTAPVKEWEKDNQLQLFQPE